MRFLDALDGTRTLCGGRGACEFIAGGFVGLFGLQYATKMRNRQIRATGRDDGEEKAAG